MAHKCSKSSTNSTTTGHADIVPVVVLTNRHANVHVFAAQLQTLAACLALFAAGSDQLKGVGVPDTIARCAWSLSLQRVLCMSRTTDLPPASPSVARSRCCCPANSASSAGFLPFCASGGAPHTPWPQGVTSLRDEGHTTRTRASGTRRRLGRGSRVKPGRSEGVVNRFGPSDSSIQNVWTG
eukprot:6177370-Pleurochrysis_carterae.AAC.1